MNDGFAQAVADTLVPGARIDGTDGRLRADLAEVARRAEARRPDAPYAQWPRTEREALLGEVLESPGSPAGEALGRLLQATAEQHYADPATWPAIGYRSLPAGVDWPDRADEATPTVPFAELDAAYDVVVVGAGAGGGVAAHVLTAAGHRVLLVDRGAAFATSDLPRDHLRSARAFTGRSRQVDAAAAGTPRIVEDEAVWPEEPLWNANAMAVGGGTRVYGAQAWRFCPEDFRMGSTYGAPHVDWPLAYEDLEPYYERVEWEMGVSGESGPALYDGPRRRAYPMPPLPADPSVPVLARGAAKLGLDVGSPPLLINSVARDGRSACRGCGTCVGFACHAGAKNGTHNTVIRRAVESGGCDVAANTVAVRLISDTDGRVVGVELASGPERRIIGARHVVVAAGAVETARLLLASGVGTAHDQVGRYLQGHVYTGAVGIFDEVVETCLGPGASISTTSFRHHNDGLAGGGILARDFVPTPIEAWHKLVRAGLIPRFGQAGTQGMAQSYRHAAFVVGPIQEVPSPDSRVTLEPALVDRYGVPVVRLSSPGLHPQDEQVAGFLAERALDWVQASGARRTATIPWAPSKGPSAGQHQAGTCRMGTDPRHSVTDAWGRVWGHDGITVADGSLHVSNGGVNPVLTILALAWRVSDRLAQELSNR